MNGESVGIVYILIFAKFTIRLYSTCIRIMNTDVRRILPVGTVDIVVAVVEDATGRTDKIRVVEVDRARRYAPVVIVYTVIALVTVEEARRASMPRVVMITRVRRDNAPVGIFDTKVTVVAAENARSVESPSVVAVDRARRKP